MNPIFKEFDGSLIDPIIGSALPIPETAKTSHFLKTPRLRGSSRLLLTGLLAVGIGSMALAPEKANAGGDPNACQFVLGFDTLHSALPNEIGNCLDNQSFASNGDAQQHTTKGLLAWRKSDNWTAFTDGYHTWVNGPNGIQERLNTERFDFEHDNQLAAVAPIAPSTPEANPNVPHVIDYSDWPSGDVGKLQDALNTTLGFNARFTINDLDSDFKNKLGPARVARYAVALSNMSSYAEAVNRINKISTIEAKYLPDLGHAYSNGNVEINKDLVEGRMYSSGFTAILIPQILWKEITSDDLGRILPDSEAEPLSLYLASLVTRSKIKQGAEFQRTSSADQLRTQALQAIPA